MTLPLANFTARLGCADNPGLLPWEQRLEAIAPGANPYVTGDALPGNSPVFAGREDRLHQVLAHLRRPDKPGSVSVLGERRIGKSSFLRQVVEELATEPGLISVFTSSQGWDCATETTFFTQLHHAIAAQLPALPEAKVEDWRGFQAYIANAAHNHRFVLVIDEFERLSGNPHFDAEFFAHLRCLGNEPEYRCGFLTASARPLKELCDQGGIAESKFWNIFSGYTLGLLDEKAAAGLAGKPLQRCLGAAAQPPADLTALAGTHPFFLQKVLHGHIDAVCHGYPTDKDNLRQFFHDHLEHLWQARNDEERTVLLRIVDGREVENDLTLVDLRQRGLLTEQNTLCCGALHIAIPGLLPKGRDIKAVLNDLEAGGEKAAKAFDRVLETAEKVGKLYNAVRGKDGEAE
jgi:hypothetical protein